MTVRRLICLLRGHRFSQHYAECKPGYTGYLEHDLCSRCGHHEITQVPQ